MIACFVFFVIVFSILSLGAIFITAYGNAWSPWSQSPLETVWAAKGFILTTLLSIIALIGFIQGKKYGVVCGLSVSFIVVFGIMLVFLFGLNGPINHIFLLISIVLILVDFFALYSIFQIEDAKNLNLYHYLIIGFLTITTLLSLRTFFFM
ncbi:MULTISPECIES: hypothetical protein [Flavobacteriaceae]|uniref:hypothetical protein n=1 Tax=Flavobacteriaceae TaxID=49546 RepID=UPI0014914CE7|nr:MULTISPECIES: hypothetical protein [Allomuricauda]MDC6366537.1 hypothetical protein [Muricauda sp. AC10]